MTRRCSSLLLFAVLACSPVRAASAQTTSTGDVAVSYSFLRLTEGGDSLNVPAGWLVSVSRRVAPLLSMVGEAGGSYRSDEGDFQLHTFMGGVRVSAVRRTGTGPRPFAQFLAGTAVASCCGESTAVFAIEPGAGVDVPI